MKKFLVIISLILVSIVSFSQNYKEGDFSGKKVSAKSYELYNNWLIDKSTAGTIQFKYNNSTVAQLSSTGGLTATSITNSGTTTTANITMTGTLTTGANICDTASFTTTAQRKAVYISGASATDIYIVSPKNKSSSLTSYMVTGDALNWFAKADSLIVTRQAGTTSGLTFSYLRIK